MLREVLEILAPRPGGSYLDATFGGGGHARALLDAQPDLHLLALDRDPAAAVRAAPLAAQTGSRFTFRSANFASLGSQPESGFDGILFDLGVSSYHLDDPARGFSFRWPGPADMRMDPREGEPASRFCETAPRAELIHAIRDLGEEPRWRAVVEAIIGARGTGRLERTEELAAIVAAAAHKPRRDSRLHPATLSFQGLRMAVNGELDALQAALPAAFDKLTSGGILTVISFHSLEDRIVKRFFNRLAGRPEHGEDSTPQQERVRLAVLLTPRPRAASPEEITINARARSARLRAVRKLPSP